MYEREAGSVREREGVEYVCVREREGVEHERERRVRARDE